MITAWETYIESLCKLNTDIRHEKMDGAKKRRTWFPYIDEESPVANTNVGSPYMQHDNFYAGSKDTQWIYTSELLILANVNTNKGAVPAEINKARALTFDIAQQFEAKILSDFENGVTCLLFEDLMGSSLTPAGMSDQTAYGWLLTVKFVKDRPEIDESKWVDPEEEEEP